MEQHFFRIKPTDLLYAFFKIDTCCNPDNSRNDRHIPFVNSINRFYKVRHPLPGTSIRSLFKFEQVIGMGKFICTIQKIWMFLDEVNDSMVNILSVCPNHPIFMGWGKFVNIEP